MKKHRRSIKIDSKCFVNEYGAQQMRNKERIEVTDAKLTIEFKTIIVSQCYLLIHIYNRTIAVYIRRIVIKKRNL